MVCSVFASALLRRSYRRRRKSPRKSSRLTKNTEHREIGLPKGTKNSGQNFWMLKLPTFKNHVKTGK